MPVRKLSLYDLLAPQFLLGFSFPDYIDRNLRVLSIEEIHATFDEELVVYSGVLVVGGDGEGSLEFVQEEPAGTSLSWNGNLFKFRLTVSRDASNLIRDSIVPTTDTTLTNLNNLFQDLRPPGEDLADPVGHPHSETTLDDTITDYPGFAFKLEILLDLLNFSLGSDWVAGKIDPVSRHLVRDTSPEYANKRVRIILPKAVLQYEQGQDLTEDPQFRINSWGGAGIDAPHDLQVGELIRMDPAIALHTGGDFGFSVDKVILDNSKETTPPEILQHFGTAEDFEGIFFRQMLIYYRNDQGAGFNFRVNDALISFAGEVSLEGALDIFLNAQLTSLSVESKIFTGSTQQSFKHGEITPPSSPPTVTSPSSPPGEATVRQNSVIQLDVSGGTPPYNIQVFRNGTNVWDNSSRQAVLDTVGEDQVYLIYVEDSRPSDPRKFAEYLSVTVQAEENPAARGGTGAPADRAPDPRRNPAVLSAVTGADAEHTIEHSDAGSGTVETIRIPGNREASVTITRDGGLSPVTANITPDNRSVSFDLPHGSTFDIAVNFPAGSVESEQKDVTFLLDKPFTPTELAKYLADVAEVDVDTSDPQNPIIQVPTGATESNDGRFLSDIAALQDWVRQKDQITGVVVDGFASLNSAGVSHDLTLSQNRKQVGDAIIQRLGITAPISGSGSFSNQGYDGAGLPNGPGRSYRAARMVASFQNGAEVDLSATISRDALPPESPGGTPSTPQSTPDAPPMPNNMPTVLRRLGVRIRLERNNLVLLELSGEIDFETELEQRLRTAASSTDSLQLTNASGNDNPEDGVVDFKIIYTYNTATSEYGITLSLGSHPEDKDGLLHMNNPGGSGSSTFKNIFGALLVFAPIINASAVSAANDSESAGNWIALGASLAAPVAIGGLNIFRTRRAILYGGELIVKFSEPDPAAPQSVDVGIVFDYGVEFDIVIQSLGIGVDRDVPNPTAPPLKVRYKAIGFNLHYDSVSNGMTYTAVFDASKGYDLQLSDPSLFSLPAPLGNLFAVSAARLGRVNPLTLEIDLAIKVDLGIITVDKFKIKIPLESDGNVQIMPSGVKVNIPGTLVGSGFVEIVDTDVVQADGSTIHAKGIEGGVDLTVVPVKLRVAGNLAVTQLRNNDTGREGVGIFVGLRVEFPSPIVLGASGLGLYGIMGLFAMHYRRLESDTVPPTDPIGPALKWLVKAEGDPTKLKNSSNEKLWGPNFDRWAFGVGVILGTMDTGFTANFQGMFILELPGPRILIMTKMKFISAKPEGVDDDYNEITTGLLAVIDLDFEQEKITIGILIDFEIEEILQLKIPIEILFKLNDPSYWHFWLGTYTVPASANILNMVRGSAYFMIQGHELTFPSSMNNVPSDAPILNMTLYPVAIALGLEASLLFGSESIGLYLKIGAGFHVGLSFTPFVIVGSMYFMGKLRLFIVSIGAEGTLDVLITKKDGQPFYTYLHGEVCGKVDFFFFSISACIEITIEKGTPGIDPPALINGMYLQSYAPVLVSGQGGDKPIDASLGNAVEGVVTTGLPVVPIDTVLVVQMNASPLTGSVSAPFLDNITTSPDIRPGGWVQLSKDTRVKYDLTAISLTESGGLAYSDPDDVPATWRVERNNGEILSNGARTNVDLALFSRVPTTADRALERSTELEKLIEVRWGNLCDPAAPPASVLFTFCGELLGPSPSGWNLNGIAKPDPPDTIRIAPPDTSMHVEDYYPAGVTAWEQMIAQLGLPYKVHARVVGVESMEIEQSKPGKPICLTFSKPKIDLSDLINKGTFIRSGQDGVDLKINVFEEGRIDDVIQRENLLLEKLNELDKLAPAQRQLPPTGPITDIPIDLPEVLRPILPKLGGGNDDIQIPSAKIGEMNGFRGVFLEGKMAIHFRKPVCRADLTLVVFPPGRKVTLVAYNAKRKKVEKVVLKFSRRNVGIPIMASLRAEQISMIVISAPKVEGLITRICYYRDCEDKPRPVYNECYRALQLPYCNTLEDGFAQEEFANNPDIQEVLQRYLKAREEYCYLDLETGACKELLFFAAVGGKLIKQIVVQELDEADNVLHQYLLADLSPQLVNNILTDLPSDWLDPALPWRAQVVPVTQFLFSGQFAAYQKYMFSLSPMSPEKCVTVRFVTNRGSKGEPAMYLGAVERLQLTEIEQHDAVTASGEGSLDTLDGYLSHAEGDRPLLKKDTIYHLRLDYTATVETKDASGSTNTSSSNHHQTFSFQTDNEPPEELKPYVLGTTPEHDDDYHFFKDPLKVVFNDRSTLELYEAYGKSLMGVIRGADGETVTNSPDSISELEALPASVLTPYREFVEALIEAGLLPCTGGIIPVNHHGLYQAPFELKPLMGYTFDIDLDPADTLVAGESRKPLFRRSFRTSRFADLEDFADAVNVLPVYSVALTSPISGLPTPGPVEGSSRTDIATIKDIELQEAITNAGLPPTAGADKTGVWIMWADTGGGFRPYAVLIDAAEPMWRLRSEPEKKIVKDGAGQEIDPQFVIWEEGRKMSLELLEHSGTSIIDHYVRSSGGTRCLLMLDQSALSTTGDTPLTVDIRQPASTFYDMPEKRETLITINLEQKAPWEE
jgi:hypothetical protein